MLALSTRFTGKDLPLDRAVARCADLGVRAVALHRPARGGEAGALAAHSRRLSIVAVFGTETGGELGRPILVVEGGPAEEDREASLEKLCRRLHPLRDYPVALRTPESGDHHPAPEEIALIRGELSGVGYWHDAQRGGADHLDAAARWILGASFHPLTEVDLAGLRDALTGNAPAVVDCPEGTSKEELREALARAGSYFSHA